MSALLDGSMAHRDDTWFGIHIRRLAPGLGIAFGLHACLFAQVPYPEAP